MTQKNVLHVFARWKASTSFSHCGFIFVAMAVFSICLPPFGALAGEFQAPGTGSSPIPPFDLVWDSVDGNSLPLNPFWRAQKYGHILLPNFRNSCGPAFSDWKTPFPFDRSINFNVLPAICTTQAPTPDFAPQPIPCDTPLSDRVLPGHLNWAITTHAGLISWSGYDNNDGDFNLELTRPDHAAETDLNVFPDYGMHLEFKGTETTSNFGSPWWVDFREHAFASHNNGEDAFTASLIDNKAAVVTGLLGIDGVHGGYTELHPVFSLAVQTDHNAVQGGADAHWAFFLRNQGGEGCCSNHLHQWDGLVDPHGGWNWYFIQLPPPPEVPARTSVIVTIPTPAQVWSNLALAAPVITQDSQWVYLGFRLPEPVIAPELDGEISLHYAFQNSNQNGTPGPIIKRPALALTARARVAERGDDWEEIRKHLQPTDLEKLDGAIKAAQLASAKPRPHTIRLTIAPAPSILPHQPLMGPGHRGQLTRAKTIVDPSDEAARQQLELRVRSIVPKEVIEPKRP